VGLVSEFLEYGFDEQNAAVFNRKLFFLVLVNYHSLLHVKRYIFCLAICAHCVSNEVVQKALDSFWAQGLQVGIVTNRTQVKVILAFLF
jgi:hypothetical protein